MATFPLHHAFKEWAVVCQALAGGRHALLLRKGGIAETSGDFTLEHSRFWLYPTYVHQQATGIRPEAAELLQQAEAERPPVGTVRFTHWAEVADSFRLDDLATALRLAPFHLLSSETVTSRFLYRSPGLTAFVVRVYLAMEVVEMPETAAYVGCRSWVELEQPLAADDAAPVLADAAFADLRRQLHEVAQLPGSIQHS